MPEVFAFENSFYTYSDMLTKYFLLKAFILYLNPQVVQGFYSAVVYMYNNENMVDDDHRHVN